MWLSVWSEVQIVCVWSSWCHCHLETPSSLASFKSRLVLAFWYQLTQVVVPEKTGVFHHHHHYHHYYTEIRVPGRPHTVSAAYTQFYHYCNMWTREYSFEWGIITLHLGKKYASRPLPILAEAYTLYKSHFRMSLLYYRSPDGAAIEQTQRCCGEWCNSSHLVGLGI